MNNMSNPRTAFEHALLIDRVVRRCAKMFSSPEAMQEYLKSHPKADPAKHSVKKDEGGAPKSPRAKKPKSEAPAESKPQSAAPEVKSEPATKGEPNPEAKSEPKEGTFEHAKKKFNESKTKHEKAKADHEKAVAEHDEHHKTKSSEALEKGGKKGWQDWHDKSKSLKKKLKDADKARNSTEADMQNAHAHGVALRDKEKSAK